MRIFSAPQDLTPVITNSQKTNNRSSFLTPTSIKVTAVFVAVMIVGLGCSMLNSHWKMSENNLDFIKNGCKKLIKDENELIKLVQHNPSLFKCAADPLLKNEKLLATMIKINPRTIDYMNSNLYDNPQLMEAAWEIRSNYLNLPASEPQHKKDFLLHAIRIKGLGFEDVSIEFRTDKEILFALCETDPRWVKALKGEVSTNSVDLEIRNVIFEQQLTDDKDFMLKLSNSKSPLLESFRPLKYAGPNLQNDYGFVYKILSKSPGCDVSATLKDDPKFALLMLSGHDWYQFCISDKLMQNKEFLKAYNLHNFLPKHHNRKI